jgi:ABC-type glycerol-3-phosphate transport system permease component
MRKRRKTGLDPADAFIRGATYVIMTIASIIGILPFMLLLGSSFTSETSIRLNGFNIIPREFSTYAWEILFVAPEQMIGAYIVTILLTATGTAIGLFIISMTGYALSRRDFPFRNHISFYIYFTSLFSAGLVPFYLLMVQTYNLRDSYLAVLLPLLMSPWLIILMKNFAKDIPFEVTESGKIDGATDFRIFASLILPMLTPAMATIGLFLAIGYWNEWYYSSLFLTSNVLYKPLQFHLYNVINRVEFMRNSVAGAFIPPHNLPGESLKMATAMLATGPVVFAYAFVQKYFIAGITVGAVKG